MAIRTVLFDMGNVLVFFSHERMCRQIAETCGLSFEQAREILLDSRLQFEFERGRISEEEFHRHFETIVNRRIDRDGLLEAGSNIFWSNDSISPVLDSLRAGGIRLVLLSNTCHPHFRFVRDNFQVLDRFDDFVLSCDAGAIKPEPAIFEAALGKIECRPEECFYTDDISEYIEAGRRHGLDAEIYSDTPSLISHLQRRGLPVPT